MSTGGLHNAIDVDGVDYANSWSCPANPAGAPNYPTRNCVFWVGTLAAGSHWIAGRFALGSGTGTATINNRVLLIYILNGDEYRYVDDGITWTWTNTTTLVADTASSVTFTPSGSCVALFLYNAADNWSHPDIYPSNGKVVYLNVNGINYAEAMQSLGSGNSPDSVFTAYSASLTASSTTVKGMFADNYLSGYNVSINERELAVLLFDPTTLSDMITSGTAVTTTSNTLVNDTQATITRTTTETRELLAVAMGDRANSAGNKVGDCYGIAVNGVDYTNSRSCPQGASAAYAGSEATGWAGTISAGTNYVQGRISNNNSTETAKITNRIVIALWLLPSGQSSPPTYSSPSASSTAAGTNCVFSDFISSSVGLSFGIFSTNNTGHWQNDSAVAFSGATSAWLNSTKTLNATVGNVVSARWFANDTSNDWSASSFLNITVTSGSLISTSENQYVSGDASQHHLVQTSMGILYAVYYKNLNGQLAIYVKSSGDYGQSWVNDTLISTLSRMIGYLQWQPDISIDSNNNLYVLWVGTSSSYSAYQIWFSMFNGTGWSTPIDISTYSGMSTTAQACPDGATDSGNNLHVVWYGYATGYTSVYQIWEEDYNGTWSTITRLSTATNMNANNLYYPAITVDSSNNLDVIFRGIGTSYSYSQMWFTQRTGTSWSSPVVISTYAGMNSANQISPAIAIDSNNWIYATWLGTATGYANTQIWVAMYNGTWQTPVIISTYSGMSRYAQEEPAVSVDSGNRVYVFWDGMATGYTDYNKVWETTYNGAWNTPQILQPNGQNKYPTVQWSRYPSFNIPNSRLDYVFTVGTSSPYNVTFSYLSLPEAANASRLVITAGAGQSVVAGQLSGPITVQRQDQYGNPVTSGSLTVTLNSTSLSATFYSDAGNTSATSVTIVNGSSTVSFWYKDTNAGSPTLTASAVGLASATTSLTITSAPSPPTYSNISISSTFAGQPCTFSSHWSDTYGLSGYIFSTNNTVLWQNTTWTPFSGTSALASVTQNLNSNIGTVIAYNWYANNTNGLWNNTGIQTLTATDSALGLSPFSIVSNSTVSELAFNSTSQVLEFTVSGPSGTTGFTNVTITKTLISDISTLEVYLDGNETNYTVNDLTYSWLIHFTYHHSTHKVLMDFVSQQTKTSVTPLNGVPVAIVGLVIVIFITLAITIKRKAKFPNSTKQKRSSNQLIVCWLVAGF